MPRLLRRQLFQFRTLVQILKSSYFRSNFVKVIAISPATVPMVSFATDVMPSRKFQVVWAVHLTARILITVFLIPMEKDILFQQKNQPLHLPLRQGLP
jgi:hypothetical protein